MPVLYDSKGQKSTTFSPPKTSQPESLRTKLVRSLQHLTPPPPNPYLAALHSYCSFPAKTFFQTQDADEEVILLLRRHFVTNVPWIFLSLLALIIPLILFPLFFSFLFPTLSRGYQLVAVLSWYLLVFSYAFVNFLLWYFHVYIVTNKRVIDIDVHGLTLSDITSAKLEQIQDITLKRVGIIRTIFDYGNVFIQTAGTVPSLEFEAVPRPAAVIDILEELVNKS